MLAATLKLVDVTGTLAAFLIATVLISVIPRSVSIEHFLALRLNTLNFYVILGLLLVWHLGFSAFGLYESGTPLLGRNRTPGVLKGTAFGAVALSVAAICFSIDVVSAQLVLVIWGLSAAGLVGLRFLLSLVAALLRNRPTFQRRVLIVGTRAPALRYARQIQQNPESGCPLVGFVEEPSPGVESAPRVVCDLEAE